MSLYRDTITTCPVDLPRSALSAMLRCARTLFQLSRTSAYRQKVLETVPEIARFNPGHDSVMMGYDFHLEGETPRLIEVNTNAGGGLLAYLAHHPSAEVAQDRLPERLYAKFLQSFEEELSSFTAGVRCRPAHIAIVDENPREQYLYQEMKAFADLFRAEGIEASVADPSELEAGEGGVFYRGEKVDLVYNRHTDFYLETPPMAGLRQAYGSKAVCLTPNPFTYALLGDKRRLEIWSDAVVLKELGVGAKQREVLERVVPESRLLCRWDRDRLWKERKDWVFKPVSRFGSRGVLLGRKISRGRFEALDPEDTLVQRLVPPSVTLPCGEGEEMKTDFRLYVYRQKVLGVAARLYQGQVTNLRTPGGGLCPCPHRLKRKRRRFTPPLLRLDLPRQLPPIVVEKAP